MLYHSVRTKISKTTQMSKVKLTGKQLKAFFGHKKAKQHQNMKGNHEGFLLAQEDNSKVITIIFQDVNGKTVVVSRCTLGLHVAYA